MAKLRLIVQLIEDDDTRHQNDMDIPISDFKDPELVNEEDLLHAFNSTFGFLMKSVQHFVRYWARSAEGTAYFKRLEQYAHDRGLGTADSAALIAGAIHSSEEGMRILQLPLQVLEPKEGEDIPRPGFPSRYERKPVI